MAKNAEPYQLKYDPGPVTLDFLKDKEYRASLLIGPFGTGKTTGAAFKKLMLQSKWIKPDKHGRRRSRFAVVRNTYPQLRDTTIRSYLDWFPPGEFGGRYKESDKQAIYRIGDREIEILFRALDDENDVRNLLSLELSGAHVDEAREVRHSIFKGILGRVGRYPSIKDYDGDNPFLSSIQVDLTSNYPNRDHWLYRDFVSSPIPGYRMFEQGQGENKHNLPPNYYENLELDYADRPDLLKTLVRGEWGITYIGKLVYPEFNRLLHVAKVPLKLVENGTIIRGWDNTGLHPGCVITQINSTGQWLVKAEFWQDDVGIMDFGEMVQLWCNQHLPGAKFRDIGDPAGKNRDSNKMSPKDYLKKIGIRIEDGIQTFKARRESVSGRLTKLTNGQPSILIDPACTLLIDGFEGGYCYKEIGSSGIYKNEPEKNKYADCFAAGTLVSTLWGNRPIESLEVGDYVLTPSGYKRVTATMNSLAPTVEMVTTSGSVRCTLDHRMAHNLGFTRADALRYDNILVGIGTKEAKLWGDRARENSKRSTESGFISTKAGIFSAIGRAFAQAFTAMSGNVQTAQFQKGNVSITKITIDPITDLKTLNCGTLENMHLFTQKSGTIKMMQRFYEALQRLRRPLNNGILPWKGSSGTENTGLKYGRGKKNSNSRAPVAESLIPPSNNPSNGDFALHHVRPLQGLRRALTMLFASVANAALAIKPTNTNHAKPAPRFVRLQKPIESERVYDITVENAHVFFANGILVSNCHDALQYPATRLFMRGTQEKKIDYSGVYLR